MTRQEVEIGVAIAVVTWSGAVAVWMLHRFPAPIAAWGALAWALGIAVIGVVEIRLHRWFQHREWFDGE